jgi:hypothetical protein
MLTYGTRPAPSTIAIPIELPLLASKRQILPGAKVYLIEPPPTDSNQALNVADEFDLLICQIAYGVDHATSQPCAPKIV